MALEITNLTLKHHGAYMNGTHSKRIDTLLSHLYAIAAEMKTRLMIASACKGTPSRNRTNNSKAHKLASRQSFSKVTQTTVGWNVQSFDKPNVVYEVKETDLAECTYDPCYQACIHCEVCWHVYSCNCPVALQNHGRSHSCKHAHLVRM